MVIGNGDIASVLPDRKDLLFFASGVSNSQENNEEAYKREKTLLFEQDWSKHIVYFSSLSIFYKDSRYTKHKRNMEGLVKHAFNKYTIIRIGNITWGDNPNTFLNAYKKSVRLGQMFYIKDEYRYMVEKQEFLHWIDLIPPWSCEMNIPGKRMKVSDAVLLYT